MKTFAQFLEQKRATGQFGMGTGRSPTGLLAGGVPKPAKPHKPTYAGMNVAKIYKMGNN
jgi:hypothetical protein